ncbi:hypothetical protein M8C21_007164 [Ambrosia artemisiifolia]|uniref:Uncharacterized protein n=1 Tax=Ambrosia artemisiifolia TaxID=4212 RepID=A0AAD5D8A1_AMBAR|nr:hypothetical protein M8C21_007164 [Ambrosia artemisiifolia]
MHFHMRITPPHKRKLEAFLSPHFLKQDAWGAPIAGRIESLIQKFLPYFPGRALLWWLILGKQRLLRMSDKELNAYLINVTRRENGMLKMPHWRHLVI